MTSRFCEYWS